MCLNALFDIQAKQVEDGNSKTMNNVSLLVVSIFDITVRLLCTGATPNLLREKIIRQKQLVLYTAFTLHMHSELRWRRNSLNVL